MEIKILKKEYLKSEKAYHDFIKGELIALENFTSDNPIEIGDYENFSIYLNEESFQKREESYLKAFKIVGKIINKLNRDAQMNGEFWYSYLLTEKRVFILETYPQVRNSEKVFRNIVLKKFDWENYIYKLILGAQYIMERIKNEKEQEYYFRLIANNLDVYNYIIKYEIFRNDEFLLNVLKIIDKNKLSEICKKRIPASDGLGKDERYGRRVIFELNKSYPMVLSPMMTAEELEPIFLENLNKYLSMHNQEISLSEEEEKEKQKKSFFDKLNIFRS